MKLLLFALVLVGLLACSKQEPSRQFEGRNLIYNELATVWDEAMPLGNGMVGNLVWEKEGKLRFSLDRADLWDLRPMENIDFEKWTFNDVHKHWKNDTYHEVQNVFDVPYNKLPAPSKIPAGALEFDISALGKVQKVTLDVEQALCMVEWESGAKLSTFVHAERAVGWYKFENLPAHLSVEMKSPAYNRENEGGYTSQSRNDLNQLAYEQGTIEKGENKLTYNQKGWGEFAYQIHTEWEQNANSLIGCWSVSSENKDWDKAPKAAGIVAKEDQLGFDSAFKSHLNWWRNYWAQSSISVPDSVLQRQYYLEMYKFGSAARADAPPISLQAVWTADHGKLPPWKGDFHHDLNTQLSYWPAYAGNYLNLEEGFINWLWKYRPAFKKYTHDYFGVNGMNVPGVTTLDGEPMGGWIQYSFGQGVGAWLSHHFYLHWKYTMDRDFLKTKAYPWIKDVAIFIDEISEKDENGIRRLKMSSSPEIYDNSRKAWFAEMTNYDCALMRFNLEKAAELASELGLDDDAEKWTQILSEFPELAVDAKTGFMFASEFPYNESHRHFSHLMGFHPLGLVDYSNGKADQEIINNTLQNLEKQSSDNWTGYSFSWQGNLYARAFNGDKAAEVLTIFAECFCLRNSFHANGDQCKAGHSNMHYRPFTLEGNFAFASGIQEMLLQSHTGIIKLFPALPQSWKDTGFTRLRTYGAFLISADMKDGKVSFVKIKSEKGGLLKLENPFGDNSFEIDGAEMENSNGLITVMMVAGQEIVLSAN